MRAARIERVPAHMRDLAAPVGRPIASTSPAIQPRPGRLDAQPARRHKLHADANAKKRPAALPSTASSHRLDHAGRGFEARAGNRRRRQRPAARYDRRAPRLGLGGHLESRREPGLARGALEGFVGGMQIARPVIDDRDVHSAARIQGFRSGPGRRRCRSRPRPAGGGGGERQIQRRAAGAGRAAASPSVASRRKKAISASSRCGRGDDIRRDGSLAAELPLDKPFGLRSQ